jgi:phosphoglucomutase
MRIYLELIEVAGEESAEADFIRVDVTGWSDSDVNSAVDLLKQQATVYEHYVLQRHYCYHDEGKSCTTETLDSK